MTRSAEGLRLCPHLLQHYYVFLTLHILSHLDDQRGIDTLQGGQSTGEEVIDFAVSIAVQDESPPASTLSDIAHNIVTVLGLLDSF